MIAVSTRTVFELPLIGQITLDKCEANLEIQTRLEPCLFVLLVTDCDDW